jgi:hypothetical protein
MENGDEHGVEDQKQTLQFWGKEQGKHFEINFLIHAIHRVVL